MSAAETIERARRHGIEIMPDGNHLRVRAPHEPPAEIIEALRQHKRELLDYLSRRDERAIVAFNLGESPEQWPICIGAPRESVEAVIERLRGRYGERLIHAAPYRPTQNHGSKR